MIDDGTITIGTEVSTKGLKKDLIELQKELEKYDKEAQELLQQKAELQVDTSQLDELQEKLKEAKRLVNELSSQQEIRYDSNGVEYTWFPEGYEEAISEMGQIETQIINIQQAQEDIKPQVEDINGKLENNKLIQEDIKKEYQQQLAVLKQITEEEYEQNKQAQEEKEKEKRVASLTSKFKRMGLALLGVGSVYGLVRKAARSWLNEHQETAQAFKQVWTNIMEFLSPIIEKIAKWLLKLIAYLNIFVKAITGGKLDLTKNMNKNTKSINNTNKAMKELNNQMASFDEATKLHDNTVSDNALDDSNKIGTIFNEEDLNQNVVNAIKKIGETFNKYGKEIGIGAGAIIGGAMLGKIIGLLGGSEGAGAIGKGLSSLAGNIASIIGKAIPIIGIGAAIGAVAYTGYQVGKKTRELTNENKELEKMETKTEKAIKVEKALEQQSKRTNLSQEELANTTQAYNGKIDLVTSKLLGYETALRQTGSVQAIFEDLVDSENSTISTNQRLIDANKKDLYKWIDAQDEMFKSNKLTDEQIKFYNATLRNSYERIEDLRDEYGVLSPEMDAIQRRIYRSILLLRGEGDEYETLTKKIKDFLDLPDEKEMRIFVETKIATSVSNFAEAGKNFAEATLLALQAKLKVLNGVNSTTASIKKAFGLASGGIVNLPGRGVPVGANAVAGESGAEGIIPLTDSQAMETLGEAIGRHVIINANITNSMNGRVISRELQKINSEDTFGYNR